MIDVLLATHNGEEFLEALLTSICDGQTFRDFRIIARDDASTDKTRAILSHVASRTDRSVILLDDGGAQLGAARSFSRLMEHSPSPYVAFADQDDVWLPRKLATLHQRLLEVEHQVGPDTPLLAHCDLTVVGRDLKPIAESFWEFQKIDPHSAIFPRTLIENTVTGCAMLANRALIDLASPVPEQAVMHDWWLALVASAFGRIIPVSDRLVLYRQHGGNVVGAKSWGWRSYWSRARRSMGRQSVARAVTASTVQARSFLDRYGNRLSAGHRQHVEAFLGFPSRGFLGRRATLSRHRLLPANAVRKLLWLLWV